MATTADVIGVEVVAWNEKLARGMRQSERIVDSSARRMARSSVVAFGGTAGSDAMLSRAKTFMAIRGGIAVAEAAVHAYNAVVARAAGDTRRFASEIDKVVETFRRLPLVGSMVDGIESLIYSIMGELSPAGRKQFKDLEAAMTAEYITAQLDRHVEEAATDAERIRREFDVEVAKIGMEAVKVREALAQLAAELGVDVRSLVAMNDAIANEKIRSLQLNRDRELKSLEDKAKSSLAPFDKFQTILGTFKAPTSPMKPATSSDQKETTKQTKRAADSLARIERNIGSGIVAFA